MLGSFLGDVVANRPPAADLPTAPENRQLRFSTISALFAELFQQLTIVQC